MQSITAHISQTQSEIIAKLERIELKLAVFEIQLKNPKLSPSEVLRLAYEKLDEEYARRNG